MAFSSESGQAAYVDNPQDEQEGWFWPEGAGPDYLSEPLYPGFIDPEAPTSPPDPGTGTAWVTSPEEDLMDSGYWEIIWRDGTKHTGCCAETKEEAVMYALSLPATRWVTRDHSGDPWTDLTRASHPSPGTGTVQVTQTRGTELWAAVWAAEGATKHTLARGPQEDTIAWALAQPAQNHLILVEDEEGYIDWVELKPAAPGETSLGDDATPQ